MDQTNTDTEDDIGDGPWRWEVSPHPYDSQYDTFVTNDDDEASRAISYSAEMYLWDGNDGGTRTLTVKMNPEIPNKSSKA